MNLFKNAEVIVIDVGDEVYCDYCGDDFTKSDAVGGLQFQSKAACPGCAIEVEKSARRFNEMKFIRARCPEGKSFANWVRQDLRA